MNDRPPPDSPHPEFPRPPDEVLEHYAVYDEWDRLTEILGRIEEDRTREISLRHLPPPPARILDVGGGPGRYTHWLAGLGYEVHLIDPVPRHVVQAMDYAPEGGDPASATVGDARALEHAEGSCDAVLLLGPLYHLIDRKERLRALREAFRVLAPGAPVLAAAISRFASAIDGLDRGFADDEVFRKIVNADLDSGIHLNPTDDRTYFTTAYFHHPDEIGAELTEAGFERVEVLAVEGIAWVAPDLERRWTEPVAREVLEALLRRLEREPALRGASPHLLGVGYRPPDGN
jgi:SAM-dependent methyltransferase